MSTSPPEAMKMLCAACKTEHECHPDLWFNHIWLLYTMSMAGYPFAKNDLSLEEWFALAEMKHADAEVDLNA